MGWIVKVVVASFVVGYAISVLDIDPGAILTDTWATIRAVADVTVDLLRWAIPYILIGAVVVVPVALVGLLLRRARERSRS